MTIEITSPEVEALIQDYVQAGAFKTPEEAILHALRSSIPTQPNRAPKVLSAREAANRITALQRDVRPDPEGWTTQDYINHGRL